MGAPAKEESVWAISKKRGNFVRKNDVFFSHKNSAKLLQLLQGGATRYK